MFCSFGRDKVWFILQNAGTAVSIRDDCLFMSIWRAVSHSASEATNHHSQVKRHDPPRPTQGSACCVSMISYQITYQINRESVLPLHPRVFLACNEKHNMPNTTCINTSSSRQDVNCNPCASIAPKEAHHFQIYIPPKISNSITCSCQGKGEAHMCYYYQLFHVPCNHPGTHYHKIRNCSIRNSFAGRYWGKACRMHVEGR